MNLNALTPRLRKALAASLCVFAVQAASLTVHAFNIEDRVQCTANLNVRSSPSTSASILTTEATGLRGVIVDGSQSANGFTWWKITWDNGYVGWSVQDYLALVTWYSLNVASSNPNSGVYTYVGPNDFLGHADGLTPFLRYFDAGTWVTLIAPTSAGGNNFVKWTRNGADFDVNRTTTFPMSSNYTMTAVFAPPPPPTHVLTVASSNPDSGVSISSTTPDNSGNYGGATTFTRTFNQNVTAQYTAPPTASGNVFQKWQKDGLDLTNSATASVTLDANHTITAVYGSATPLIRISPLNLNFQAPASSAAPAATDSIGQMQTNLTVQLPALANGKLLEPEYALQVLTTSRTVRVVAHLKQPPALVSTDFASRTPLLLIHKQIKGLQQQALPAENTADFRLNFAFENIPAFSADVTSAGLIALQSNDLVVAIEPAHILHQHLAQGIPLIHGMTYRSTYNGSGVAIAICDSGIDYTHQYLGGGGFPNSKVIGGYNFGDANSNPIANGNAHGTACAGIAAGGVGSVGDYIGGVAYNAKLYALKITAGSGDTAWDDTIAAAWDWCVTHKSDDPSNPILVISTSFGGGRFSTPCDAFVLSALATAANNAQAAGITVLASSGNDGYCDSLARPGCISAVISVGAVYDAPFGHYYPCVGIDSCASKFATSDCGTGWYADDLAAADRVTSYANVASFLTLLAPGNSCVTLDISGAGGYSPGDYTDYYGGFGGTSAACPYAAGAVACLQSAARARTGAYLSPQDVRSRLVSTGDLITDTKVAITKPRVNLERAIDTISSAGQSFRIYNDGLGTLTVNSISPATSADWISFAPSGPFDIQAGAYRDVQVSVDFSKAPVGSSSARLLVYSNDGNNSPYPSGVYINVNRPVPILSVSPSDGLSSSGNQGGPFSPASKSFTIGNSGGGTLYWTASRGQTTWIDVSPTSGTDSGTFSISINSTGNSLSGSPSGVVYTGTVTISGNGGTTTRDVQLTVYSSQPPQLSVSPVEGLSSTGNQGGPFTAASKTFTISNSGGGTLNWTASTDTNWITLSSSSGQNAGGVTASLNANANVLAGSLSGITYNSTITFGGNGGATSRQVQLTVYNQPGLLMLTAMTVSGGSASFRLNGPPGSAFVLQSSSDLIDWVSFKTSAIPAAGWAVIIDPLPANQARRFYRAIPLLGTLNVTFPSSASSTTIQNRQNDWLAAWSASVASSSPTPNRIGLVVGRNDSDLKCAVSRPFMVFTNSGIPVGAQILSAELIFTIETRTGTSVNDAQTYFRVLRAMPADPANIAATDFGLVSTNEIYSEKEFLSDVVQGSDFTVSLTSNFYPVLTSGTNFTLALMNGHELENADHFSAVNVHNHGFMAPDTAGQNMPRIRIIYVPPPRPGLVWIQPGTFTIGSASSEQDRYADEGPQTQVTITRGFYMGKNLVTQSEYQALIGSNPSQFPGDDRRPVERVTWSDATNYCALLTAQQLAAGLLPAGWLYRLPTEAEWEYTCRAGTTSRFFFGDDPTYSTLNNFAWHFYNSAGQTHPVGQKLPNPWGLYDMGGNVWEYCQDWYVTPTQEQVLWTHRGL